MTVVELDTSRTVRYICMRVFFGCLVRGLKLIDDFGKELVDLNWYTGDQPGEWVTKRVPDSQQIIGILCKQNACMITSFEFVLSPLAGHTLYQEGMLYEPPKDNEDYSFDKEKVPDKIQRSSKKGLTSPFESEDELLHSDEEASF